MSPSITRDELAALKANVGRALTKRQPPTRKEREIVAAILAFLRTVPGVVAWRNNTGAVKTGTRFVRFGFAGASDIVGLAHWRFNCEQGGKIVNSRWFARFLAIEVKRPGQHPTQEQAAFLKMVSDAGGIAIVARSVGDVQKGLGL